MSNQPDWKFLVNLGDADPVAYGGLFVYEDTTGAYGCEMERLWDPYEGCEECDNEPDTEDTEEHADWTDHVRTHERWEVHRVMLERHKIIVLDGELRCMVPINYDPATYPHPALNYRPWFWKHLDSCAATVGMTRPELEEMLCSADPRQLALGYEVIASTHGWHEFDTDPLRLTRAEVEARYTKGELG